jgi:hypothetical protein
MKTTKIGDIVAAIPYGNEGKKKYQTVGALLQQSDNDASKGPGFTIALEPWFNPAGVPRNSDSLFLSVYHPKERPERTPEARPKYPQQRPFDGDEDDIPF